MGIMRWAGERNSSVCGDGAWKKGRYFRAQSSGWTQFDGVAGWGGLGWYRDGSAVVGGEIMDPAVDGGIGHENRDGEMTPLLAMLAPPLLAMLAPLREPLLFRGLCCVGSGDFGMPASEMGETR